MADKLPEKRRKELEDAFSIYNKKGDGSISASELEKVFASLGFANATDQLEGMIKKVDTNQNGTIEFDEFCEVMSKAQADLDSSLKAAFDVIDVDKDGFITKEELSDGMKKLGMHLTSAEIDELIKQADADGDGKIGFEDFKTMNLND
eukprot:c275_g1_i1.p1 GENE.c275_g1_i1~~c275_g1_i1.p1  ORF type:complete len:148 (-),score=65.54 c275_g1_i1:4-447(-)